MVSEGLSVTDLTVTYPGAKSAAVTDVSLDVERGEILGLLGASGSGKSSLLGGIVGIAPVTSGTVAFDGVDVTAVPTHKRDFGLMFQDGQLFPHQSMHHNIAFGLRMRGIGAQQRRERVAELLTLVGLDHYEDRPVAELSGGERQRVALARSLAPSPRFLGLDEPLSSLDAELRARMAPDIRAVLKATGTTAIVVTHDADEARVMCDRIVRMDRGRLVTPEAH